MHREAAQAASLEARAQAHRRFAHEFLGQLELGRAVKGDLAVSFIDDAVEAAFCAGRHPRGAGRKQISGLTAQAGRRYP